MPVTKGQVGGVMDDMLRDTGCSGVVVNRSMINDDQLLNQTDRCMLIDGSILKVPMAQIDIDAPYFTGISVEAMVVKSPVYGLVVGNIPGVCKADDPIKGWQPQVTRDIDKTAGVVMTPVGPITASKPLIPLKVTHSDVSNDVNVKNLVQLQKDDKSLDTITGLIDKLKRSKM
ncbi:hypothetical protein LSH36_149g02002 [Paralvinella palmiformis]|uniref:Uncharacterized protein n=1 Tax=Paralvinella palmiformis TaxID=53620 RepID=A0AAD9N8S8_9ANNE|nr:hypothetical protein LSH36_149g02002 [Paralvinella palmiformis]